MPSFESFFKNLLNDLKIELKDEFDKNFQRKGFFGKPLPPAKYPAKRGSLMMRTGDLRNSIDANIQGDAIHFTSSEPYASIQNEGGIITVSAQMKRYFWARYYKAMGGITKTKTGKTSNTKRNRDLNEEAQFWKAMALMKVGSKITIPERRFIGRSPEVFQQSRTVF